jgi:hypothetical protein
MSILSLSYGSRLVDPFHLILSEQILVFPLKKKWTKKEPGVDQCSEGKAKGGGKLFVAPNITQQCDSIMWGIEI